MTQKQLDHLILINGDKLPLENYEYIKSSMVDMEESTAYIRFAMMKDPILAILLSLTVGVFGIDRFYIGDTMKGILKLVTCGGLGIWAFIDMFYIMKDTKEKNMQILIHGAVLDD